MNNDSRNETALPVNREQLVEQLVRIQGDRSLREYARAAGVSPAALSQVLHGVYTPSRETLSKLSSPSANPSSEVTLSDLLKSAG